ncbi:MAG: alanine racemase [Cyclobacteriaceae bacterium]
MLPITRPTLLLDKNKCLTNIKRIVDKAKKSKVAYRPHFKTHQSHQIGQWFREFGIEKCTVSSLQMAKYFAEGGWRDITVAFPLNFLEYKLIDQLAASVKLNLTVCVPGTITKLSSLIQNRVNIFIEVDTGYHRTGVKPDAIETIDEILKEVDLSNKFLFAGFLSHAGHTYKTESIAEIAKIHFDEVNKLNLLKQRYISRYPELVLSIGDTPTASVLDEFEDIDEVRAGNLVFYDLTQRKIGSCGVEDIAVALVCPVVATYPERGEVVIYGGGVHFSKDAIQIEGGQISYGSVVKLNDKGWQLPETNMYVKSLSQEHGIIAAPVDDIENIKPGDLLAVLPVHSCLMAESMGSYTTLDGEVISRLRTC